MPDVIDSPTAQDVILADTQRAQQAGWVALCLTGCAGPEADEVDCPYVAWAHQEWVLKAQRAAEDAFKRII